MLNGKDVWNMWFQKEMGDLTVGDRTVYTFPKMKKSFYEMLKDTAEKFSEKTGLCDNWGRCYSYQEFLHMVCSPDWREFLFPVVFSEMTETPISRQ